MQQPKEEQNKQKKGVWRDPGTGRARETTKPSSSSPAPLPHVVAPHLSPPSSSKILIAGHDRSPDLAEERGGGEGLRRRRSTGAADLAEERRRRSESGGSTPERWGGGRGGADLARSGGGG